MQDSWLHQIRKTVEKAKSEGWWFDLIFPWLDGTAVISWEVSRCLLQLCFANPFQPVVRATAPPQDSGYCWFAIQSVVRATAPRQGNVYCWFASIVSCSLQPVVRAAAPRQGNVYCWFASIVFCHPHCYFHYRMGWLSILTKGSFCRDFSTPIIV